MKLDVKALVKELGWIVDVVLIDFKNEEVEVDLSEGNGDTSNYKFGEVELLLSSGFEDLHERPLINGSIFRCEYTEKSCWGPIGVYYGHVEYQNGCFTVFLHNPPPNDHAQTEYADLASLYGWAEHFEVIGNVYTDPYLMRDWQGHLKSVVEPIAVPPYATDKIVELVQNPPELNEYTKKHMEDYFYGVVKGDVNRCVKSNSEENE